MTAYLPQSVEANLLLIIFQLIHALLDRHYSDRIISSSFLMFKAKYKYCTFLLYNVVDRQRLNFCTYQY